VSEIAENNMFNSSGRKGRIRAKTYGESKMVTLGSVVKRRIFVIPRN
jgi:hypothetical protein